MCRGRRLKRPLLLRPESQMPHGAAPGSQSEPFEAEAAARASATRWKSPPSHWSFNSAYQKEHKCSYREAMMALAMGKV